MTKPILKLLTGVVLVLVPAQAADVVNMDRFFVVARSTAADPVVFDTPSVNDRADIVVKATIPGGREQLRLYKGDVQHAHSQSPQTADSLAHVLLHESSGYIGIFPRINNHRVVVSYSRQSGIYAIHRYQPVSAAATSFSRQLLTRAQVEQTATIPFQFLSPIVDIDDTQAPGRYFFYGERRVQNQAPTHRIYGTGGTVTNGAQANTAPVFASAPDGVAALEPYVAVSSGGVPVYIARTGGDEGVFLGNPPTAVATHSKGFTGWGGSPSANGDGTVAFYGEREADSGRGTVYLQFAGEPGPRVIGDHRLTPSVVAPEPLVDREASRPGRYLAGELVALNEFNQVAFVARDGELRGGVYASTLGRLRRLIGEGSLINHGGQQHAVQFTRLYDGLGSNGNVVFLAGTTQGDSLLVRALRGYAQTKLVDSPIVPSYAARDYLLRGVPGSGYPSATNRRIRSVGCNLVSTVNVMEFFGLRTDPGSFHSWLLEKWMAAGSAAVKERYIKPGNDFSEDIVLEYSQERVARGDGERSLYYLGLHRRTSGSNLSKIVSELRAGRAVKLRVPNGPATGSDYNRVGHYVMAYGLADPSRSDASMTRDDILIVDPGNGGIYTLGRYGAVKGYDAAHDNWLEDGDDRVYLYVSGVELPPYYNVTVGVEILAASARVLAGVGQPMAGEPMEIVLTDSQGRRTGLVPGVGIVEEIPGTQAYWVRSYSELDDESSGRERVWTHDYELGVRVSPEVRDGLTMKLQGAGESVRYWLRGHGIGDVEGNLAAGDGILHGREAMTWDFSVGGSIPEAPVVRFATIRRLSGGGIDVEVLVDGEGGDTILVIEESEDLREWKDAGRIDVLNGRAVFHNSMESEGGRRFFRAKQARDSLQGPAR